ncbi:TfuA-related McrA-glycine thioamidation protein [Methanobrevibacter sp.]|uniref:TfuA-related McrA-glycine thioamidation protein n=1 Tax=Methanobrevibacter sp. TaxID=66852 RepID=UPI00388FD2A8
MFKVIIYAGLSITFDEAKEILNTSEGVEVIYKRPIQRGDLGQAIKEHPDIIGIIDGVFHQNSAVGHKEILNVMKNGIQVFGASSMGALRASELDTLGMHGIGYVYKQYASGEVDSDDDVAVMLDSDTLEALSEPLINMKYVFTNAVSENVITKEEKDELLSIAKKTFYPKRNYSQTLSSSSLDNETKEKLIDFIRISPDIKKEDAKSLLTCIKNLVENNVNVLD